MYKVLLGLMLVLPIFIPMSRTNSSIGVSITGLQSGDVATLRLSGDDVEVVQQNVQGGIHNLDILEDGLYRLAIDAPTEYFHEPREYFFRVEDGRIINRPGFVFEFNLIPPAEQDHPPCRVSRETDCLAEYTIDLVGPEKQPVSSNRESLDPGYHYVGPAMIVQSNQGIWGRSYVIDPNISYTGRSEFFAVRVYAANADNWMEAGWAEVSWDREDIQKVYVFESAYRVWRFYPEYQLTAETPVEVQVRYVPADDRWQARIFWDGNWDILAEENIGFRATTLTPHGGEIFTRNDNDPILPMCRFDKSRVKIDGIWQDWDSRYRQFTYIDARFPYDCNMLEKYYDFVIYSPNVLLPNIKGSYEE